MKQRVRAILEVSCKYLLIHRIKNGDEYWVFPGGGVEVTETLEEALERECYEELGIRVSVCSEFFRLKHEINGKSQEEVFYKVSIVSGTIGTGDGPEFHKSSSSGDLYELSWLTSTDLAALTVLPEAVKTKLLRNGG